MEILRLPCDFGNINLFFKKILLTLRHNTILYTTLNQYLKYDYEDSKNHWS